MKEGRRHFWNTTGLDQRTFWLRACTHLPEKARTALKVIQTHWRILSTDPTGKAASLTPQGKAATWTQKAGQQPAPQGGTASSGGCGGEAATPVGLEGTHQTKGDYP